MPRRALAGIPPDVLGKSAVTGAEYPALGIDVHHLLLQLLPISAEAEYQDERNSEGPGARRVGRRAELERQRFRLDARTGHRTTAMRRSLSSWGMSVPSRVPSIARSRTPRGYLQL